MITQRGRDENLDVAGITAILKGATDKQVSGIIASVCGARPQLQDKMLEQLVQPPAPRCSGTIKNFFLDKQFGFIDSPDTFQLYQRDVFLSGNQIAGFGPGARVTFVVTLGKNGQPQAQDLQPDTENGGGGQMQWTPELEQQMMDMANAGQTAELDNLINMMNNQGGNPGGQKRGAGQMSGVSTHIPPVRRGRVDPNAPRFIGVIKNFSLERKFGFIECAEITQQYGRDAFLSNMQLGGCQVGQTVSFAVGVNTQGQPQAQDLQDAGNGTDILTPMQAPGAGAKEMCGDFRNGNCQRGAVCRFSHEMPQQQQQQQFGQATGQELTFDQVQQQFGHQSQQPQEPVILKSGRPSRFS